MAKVLSLTRSDIRDRLKLHPHLNIVHPQDPVAKVTAPTPESTMVRTPTPGVTGDEIGIVPAIKEAEKLIHDGLEKFGVPADTLLKLRELNNVGVVTGQFLAQSVIDTQTLYTIELYKIPERLDYIKRTYLECEDPLPTMEVMFWQRAYTELLEQLGKGKDRMIQGAEAIGAMIKDAQERENEKNGGAKKRKVKANW